MRLHCAYKGRVAVIARRDSVERLDKHFHNLAREAFARYGFAYADLIMQWPAMVGEALAVVSAPERLRWPRLQGAAAGRKQGGTLVVRVAEGRALELQHLAPRIIERINRFYGYEAVVHLKIVQGPLPVRSPGPPRPAVAATISVTDAAFDGIADDALKAALRRLAAGAVPGQENSRNSTSTRQV
jgi:hypothetical protein